MHSNWILFLAILTLILLFAVIILVMKLSHEFLYKGDMSVENITKVKGEYTCKKFFIKKIKSFGWVAFVFAVTLIIKRNIGSALGMSLLALQIYLIFFIRDLYFTYSIRTNS